MKALKEVPWQRREDRSYQPCETKESRRGPEEAATEIMNSINDKIIMGDKSNYDTSVRYYKSLGLSDEEAKQKRIQNIAGSVGLAALGRATSGVIMGGGAQAGNILQRNAARGIRLAKAVPQEEPASGRTDNSIPNDSGYSPGREYGAAAGKRDNRQQRWKTRHSE